MRPAAHRFTLACGTAGCKFQLGDLKSIDIPRLIAGHVKTHPGHAPKTTEDLPKHPTVGDRVRLKPELRAAAAAAYDGLSEIYIVVQSLDHDVYKEPMLKLNGPPHLARPNQLELAWRNAAERRRGLAAHKEQQEKKAS